jgi:predicted enzyme related to lactoylglutathione lyase/AraC-like DNA-binding protein
MCFHPFHVARGRATVPGRESAQDTADVRHDGSTPEEVVIPQRLRHLARLRRVRDRIDREYAQPLDVEALARGAHMSAGHLSREFRAAYGESPYCYLMTRRQTDQESRSAGHRAATSVTATGITTTGGRPMRIKWTRLYVNDQEQALQFYTEVLGFQKKADFSKGNYRWLTVTSPEDPEGVELILESNADPAGKEYQEALRSQGQPATQFLVGDVQAEHDRLSAEGVTFTMPVTSTTGSIIAVLDDTCGNLIQLTHLTWG